MKKCPNVPCGSSTVSPKDAVRRGAKENDIQKVNRKWGCIQDSYPDSPKAIKAR